MTHDLWLIKHLRLSSFTRTESQETLINSDQEDCETDKQIETKIFDAETAFNLVKKEKKSKKSSLDQDDHDGAVLGHDQSENEVIPVLVGELHVDSIRLRQVWLDRAVEVGGPVAHRVEIQAFSHMKRYRIR